MAHSGAKLEEKTFAEVDEETCREETSCSLAVVDGEKTFPLTESGGTIFQISGFVMESSKIDEELELFQMSPGYLYIFSGAFPRAGTNYRELNVREFFRVYTNGCPASNDDQHSRKGTNPSSKNLHLGIVCKCTILKSINSISRPTSFLRSPRHIHQRAKGRGVGGRGGW